MFNTKPTSNLFPQIWKYNKIFNSTHHLMYFNCNHLPLITILTSILTNSLFKKVGFKQNKLFNLKKKYPFNKE